MEQFPIPDATAFSTAHRPLLAAVGWLQELLWLALHPTLNQ